jgi:CTP synthase (UTP-ammonia lyase)
VKNAAPTARIALVGDQSPDVKAHAAILRALALATDQAGGTIQATWIPTNKLNGNADCQLRGFQGVWCVPGSPYASMEGALQAIRFAREHKVPFLGTCGGSQHALIEYCRNVLGLADADHAESNPNAHFALIAPLPCALRETEARILLNPGSRVRAIYGCNEIREPFNCGFGLNPKHQQLFGNAALKITGAGDDGIARVVELDDHPFFIATLFQPERSAFKNVSHPLIAAFLQAAVAETRRSIRVTLTHNL